MRAITDAAQSGLIKADPVLVISNNEDSGALQWARQNNLKTLIANKKTCPDKTERENTILHELQQNAVTHVILSGYMQMLGINLLQSFPNRILNVHPALLPKFGGKGMYGIHVHEAVIAAGEKETGATIHIINEHYDEGPIVAQTKIPVLPDDTPETLQSRLAPFEKKLFVAVIKGIADGTIDLDNIASEKSPALEISHTDL